MILLLDSIFSVSFFVGWFDKEGSNLLADLSALAQVIIAGINLYFVWHIFGHQKQQHLEATTLTAKLNSQNIALQSFRELILLPNINHLLDFFGKIESIATSNLSTPQKRVKADDELKRQAGLLRRNFTDLLDAASTQLEVDAQKIVDDDLLDKSAKLLIDTDKENYEDYNKELIKIITLFKQKYIKLLHQYNGN